MVHNTLTLFLKVFLQEKEILHQSTCTNTPKHNGIAERKIKHLLEVDRAMMFHMNMPKYLWGDIVLTTSYLINRMPSKVLQYTNPLKCLNFFFSEVTYRADNLSPARWISPTNPKLGLGWSLILLARKNRAKFGQARLTRGPNRIGSG